MKRLSNLIVFLFFSLTLAKAQPGSIDWNFQPDFDFGKNSEVLKIVFQPDGKIILAGTLTVNLLNGKKIEHILRLNSNGTLDLSYSLNGGFDGRIKSIVSQKDGKIIVTGNFYNFNKYPCGTITRLNVDGIIDTSFHPSNLIYGIEVLAIQSDNKILGAGSSSLIRINSNGGLDTSFKKFNTNNSITTLLIQSDGKILVGGFFTSPRNCIIRLNPNGSIDSSFNPGNMMGMTLVHSMNIQADGKILVGGRKLVNNNNLLKGPIRIYPSGKLDSSFNEKGGLDKDNFISSIFPQRDGKIILGGSFTSFNGISTNNILRLNSDGSYDSTFIIGSGFNRQVKYLAQKEESKIFVAGSFSSYNNFLASGIISINIKDESKLDLTISPNPTSGIFKINSSQSLKLITITDAVGKEILRTEPMAFDAEINLSDKSPGMYFVKVFSETGSKCQKILKQ